MLNKQIDWLLDSDEPWTRYRTMIDLLDLPESSHEVRAARQAMLNHLKVLELIDKSTTWPGYPLKRHNDAEHPIYAISTLADFGLQADDAGMGEVITNVLAHQSAEGMLESPLLIPKAFGGSGEQLWSWMLCDSPTLLYSLLAFGVNTNPDLNNSLNYLSSLVAENGWRCSGSSDLGKFKGPGRRDDPCPIANVVALKVLSMGDSNHQAAALIGTEMLLNHWQVRKERKYYLFGMGTDFSKLKYPLIWYDILHVADVLSRFSWVNADPRFIEMVSKITDQADPDGCFTPGSMYLAWKGWPFADKKNPSPWITFLVLRIQKRMGFKFN